MGRMRATLPLLRIQPARAPILRYGVSVLSTTLALIPALLLPNITESPVPSTELNCVPRY